MGSIMANNKKVHSFKYRIAYADTDRLGVVYYGNYFALFERGRTELMRDFGIRYRDLEEKDKVFLPASEAGCRYLAPARYDDLIQIKTGISKLGGAYIDFYYDVINSETGKKLAEGFTRHPFVGENWKPVRIPQKLRKTLEPFVTKSPISDGS